MSDTDENEFYQVIDSEFELDFVITSIMSARHLTYEEALPLAIEEIKDSK